MKKLFIGLAFLGSLSITTPVKAEIPLNAVISVKTVSPEKAVIPEKDIYIGCHTWTIWCNGHPAYFAIACTVQEINIWKSLLCTGE